MAEQADNELPVVKQKFDRKQYSHAFEQHQLSKSKANKARGVDETVPKMLVVNTDKESLTLLYIYNKSLESGIVPSYRKRAKVTTIIKKDDKSAASI